MSDFQLGDFVSISRSQKKGLISRKWENAYDIIILLNGEEDILPENGRYPKIKVSAADLQHFNVDSKMTEKYYSLMLSVVRTKMR